MMQTMHHVAAIDEERLARIPFKTMQLIVAFGANDPYHRIRVPVCRGDDRGSSTSSRWGANPGGFLGL
jgi:hypothetical protein